MHVVDSPFEEVAVVVSVEITVVSAEVAVDPPDVVVVPVEAAVEVAVEQSVIPLHLL